MKNSCIFAIGTALLNVMGNKDIRFLQLPSGDDWRKMEH